MTWIFKLVGAKVLSLVASVGAVLSTIALIYSFGRRSKEKDFELQSLKRDRDLRKKVNDVHTNTDVDAATERLRESGDLRE